MYNNKHQKICVICRDPIDPNHFMCPTHYRWLKNGWIEPAGFDMGCMHQIYRMTPKGLREMRS